MAKLKEIHKNYIKNNFTTSNQKLANNLLSKFDLMISKEGVRKFKISCQKEKEVVVPKKEVKPVSEKRSPRTKLKPKYPLGIDDLIKLLDSNKEHYWYEYVKKQATGKLRSDFQKLFEIIRDTTQ